MKLVQFNEFSYYQNTEINPEKFICFVVNKNFKIKLQDKINDSIFNINFFIKKSLYNIFIKNKHIQTNIKQNVLTSLT